MEVCQRSDWKKKCWQDVRARHFFTIYEKQQIEFYAACPIKWRNVCQWYSAGRCLPRKNFTAPELIYIAVREMAFYERLFLCVFFDIRRWSTSYIKCIWHLTEFTTKYLLEVDNFLNCRIMVLWDKIWYIFFPFCLKWIYIYTIFSFIKLDSLTVI